MEGLHSSQQPPLPHLIMNCNGCGTPTTDRCTRCGKSPYCGPDCQKQHWALHRDDCKDNQLEKSLERAAEILHEAYLTFRQNTWDRSLINRIVDSNQTMTIHAGAVENKPRWFTTFPSHLALNNQEMKMALLSAWNCAEPYGFLHTLITKLLGGT